MSEVQRQIDSLNQQRTEAEEAVERRRMALKLSTNREFKKLILEEFCVHECARYAQASADPNLDAAQRADSLAIAQAAGHLRRFLQVVLTMGDNAEHRILPGIDEALEELRVEEQGADEETA